MHNKFLPALIFLALFFFSLSVSHAQTMSFYRFDLPDAGAASTPFGIINSSATDVLTMDCLAANGYGLWTSTSNSTNPTSHAACMLLSNTLNTVTSVTEAQFGDLGAMRFSYNPGDGYPTEAIKCAANLNGNVRYVWLDNTSGRDNFYVEGFDPATSTNATSGIGIDFVDLGQPTVGVNSANILKNTGSPFPTATFYTESVMTVGSVVTSTNETLYPDMFDVAIDASNLYIVWEEDVLGVFSIHAAAVNLSTSAVTQLGTVGNGRRPTVSIDVRTSGGSAADIDVAYLTSVPGSINWAEWNGSTWITLPVPTLVTGTATSWSNATHARIVDASNPGQGTTDKAIYFIAEDHSTGNVSLFFNRITTPGGLSLDCTYCDGTLITTQRPSGSPIATSGGFAVKDDYIRAFANPYDGANSPFDEFHCLYVLIISPTLTPPAMGALPLMIINGTNSATGFCVSGDNTGGSFPYYDPDQVLPPPTVHVPINYQAAVNQMGFNVYWTGGAGTRLYHRRYERPFDQCITENTLITGACEVSQAISPYTVTLKNNFLTLFSDPTFFSSGPPVIDGSGYMGSGQLTIDDGVILDINPSTDGGGDFVELGCSTIAFSGSPTSQAILEVDALDQMDFYGNAHSTVEGGGEFHFVGAGDNDFSSAYGSYVSTITDPATLNIHGGTVLDVGNSSFGSSYFTSTDAEIHANFERSVLSGTGSSTSGKLMLNDHSSFTTSVIISDDPNAGDNPTILWIAWNGTAVVLPGPGTGNANYNSLTPTFATDTFEECHFTTSGNTGHATVAVAGNLYVAPNALIVDNGFIEGVSFDSKSGNAISPYWPIIFTDVTFRRVVQYGMDFWLNTQPTGFATNTEYSLLVNGCGFEGFDDFANFPNPDGIKVEAAPDLVTPMTEPTGPEDALRQDITIENNTFEPVIYFDDGGEGDGGEGDFTIGSAIHFSDATGDIIGNDISGAKYERGIWNESAFAAHQDLTWTFMCTNNIHSIAYNDPPDLGVGISTDWSTGYIKSDTVYLCEIGQLSGSNDAGHIVFSGYTNNYGPAYSGVDGSLTDITGVHHPMGTGDDPAYNIFTGNNSGGAQITLDQSVATTKVYLGEAPGSPGWTYYGDNDIVGSPDVSSTGTVNIGDVGNNYWGGSPGVDFSETNVTYTEIATYLPSQDISRAFTCSAGDVAKRKGIIPLSIQTSDTALTQCDSLFNEGYALLNDGQFEDSYDTLRLFMQQCPFYSSYGVDSYQVFTYVDAAVSGWGTGGVGRWPDFLTWLKQVLYLNPDTMWYCDDVNDMISALQNDQAAKEAAIQYVVQSGKCPALRFATPYNSASHWRHQFWLDSIVDNYDTVQPWGIYQWWVDSLVNQDTLANPYDSTIPSLQQENLQILLGPQFANSVGASSPITSEALLSAQLLENPMQDEIAVSYQMGRTALVTMELRDVLGRSVPIANAKYQLEQPGDHTATIPAPNLPPGIYYLRITTDVGDAITLKIVKE